MYKEIVIPDIVHFSISSMEAKQLPDICQLIKRNTLLYVRTMSANKKKYFMSAVHNTIICILRAVASSRSLHFLFHFTTQTSYFYSNLLYFSVFCTIILVIFLTSLLFFFHLCSLIEHAISIETLTSSVRSRLLPEHSVCSQSQYGFFPFLSSTLTFPSCHQTISLPPVAMIHTALNSTVKTINVLSFLLLLQPANKCCTVSLRCPHSLHLYSTNPPVCIQVSVSTICFDDVKIDAVFLASCLYLSHS